MAALLDHAHLTAGESVLVLGGAGGLGAYVVQLAHHFGARVTATVSTSGTADYVTALGADRVLVHGSAAISSTSMVMRSKLTYST